MRYAELHCRTNFSFLKGASHPHELVLAAAQLGLHSLAITDLSGFYGIVRANESLKELVEEKRTREEDLPQLIFGSEIVFSYQNNNDAVVLLARNRQGYGQISQLISKGRLRAEKGKCQLALRDILSLEKENIVVLGGGDRSQIFKYLKCGAAAKANHALAQLKESFGDNLYLELNRHLRPADQERSLQLKELGAQLNVLSVATNDVFFHHRHRKKLHDVLTCIDAGVSLPNAGRRLLANAARCLKSAEQMHALFVDIPEVVKRSVEIAERCTFRLSDLHYGYPAESTPEGKDANQFLGQLARQGLIDRLGEARAVQLKPQLEKELQVIEQLDYAGYFLTMWEIVRYCEDHQILCQGRGSAANSLVCYATRITSVSPDQIDMLFERFVSLERKEPPDIDLDIEHDRREEVIQHVYQKYGRQKAAMVATVIRYRHKSALRDVGKALGLNEEELQRITSYWAYGDESLANEAAKIAGFDPAGRSWKQLLYLSRQIADFPRHLSIHVGGFMLSDRPVADFVPIENARMIDRTVIQWDKNDIDALGIFKVDLLGLGMLNVIARAFRLIDAEHDLRFTLATIPAEDEETYGMIQRADTIGVFQIESRAQMGMLPRLKPKTFYDLVIEVALVRPGPIQGGMVHPYLRRRRGEESVDYAHPALEPILRRTLGVPIFQEQVMKMAVAVGGYSAGEADQLRRDMGAWRRNGKMARHQKRLYAGMRDRGIDEEYAERIIQQIEGFGSYGFPESHAAAFAHLVYVSAYLKCHYPLEFSTALINAQPMGFYQIATLVADLHRHQVPIRPVDVQHSEWQATIENRSLRLGLRLVRGLGKEIAEQIVESRQRYGSFENLPSLAKRAKLNRKQLSTLAAAGALRSIEKERRQAIWQASGLGGKGLLANLNHPLERNDFSSMSPAEELRLDYSYASSFVENHPMHLLRNHLQRRGVSRKTEMMQLQPGCPIQVAGLVIVRQRPTGVGGVIFMALEDETGLIDIVVRPQTYQQNRALLCLADILLIKGHLQADGAARSVIAQFFVNLTGGPVMGIRSRDFH